MTSNLVSTACAQHNKTTGIPTLLPMILIGPENLPQTLSTHITKLFKSRSVILSVCLVSKRFGNLSASWRPRVEHSFGISCGASKRYNNDVKFGFHQHQLDCEFCGKLHIKQCCLVVNIHKPNIYKRRDRPTWIDASI